MKRSSFENLTGRRFGRLSVLCFAEKRKRNIYWLCRCECGENRVVQAGSLRNGVTTSCGCLRIDRITKHSQSGKTRTRTYRTWESMKSRCLNPKSDNYKDYGGRGITVCDRWRDSFENFLSDMGNRPEGMSIDRIDCNGNYEPSNCRWANEKEQKRNKRNNRLLTYNNETHLLIEWAEITGKNPVTISNRLKRGWSVEKALTTPVEKQVLANA